MLAKLLFPQVNRLQIFDFLDAKRRWSLLILFGVGLLFWSSITTLLPTLSLYVKDIGGSKQEIGFVMGSFAIGLLLSRIWLGRLADQRGRKIVITLGTAVAAIAPWGYLFIHQIPLLMVLRAFHGISVAAFTTGYSALVADLAPPNRRGELIGYMSLVAPIGMGIGPVLGTVLKSQFGYQPLFVVTSSLGILCLLLSSQVWEPYRAPKELLTPDSPHPKPRLYWQTVQKFCQKILHPSTSILATVLLMVGLIFGSLVTFLPLFVEADQLQLNTGLFYAIAALASFAVRLPVGRASDRYGRGLFVTIGLLCYGISMIFLWQAETPPMFWLAAAIEGCGAGLVLPMVITLVTDRSHPDERGFLFSICIGGFDLGMALAGPIMGMIAEFIGYRNLFAVDVGLATVALIIFATASNHSVIQSCRFALGRGQDVYARE